MSGLDQPRDLAWWQLGSAVGRTSRPWVIGLATGLVVGLVDTLAIWLTVLTVWHTGQGPVEALGIGLLNGVGFASASGLAFGLTYRIRHGDTVCEPSRRRVRLPRGTRVAGARMTRRTSMCRSRSQLTWRRITGAISRDSSSPFRDPTAELIRISVLRCFLPPRNILAGSRASSSRPLAASVA